LRPGVFTSLIEDIGVKGVQVEELYGMDESEFSKIRSVWCGRVRWCKRLTFRLWQAGLRAGVSFQMAKIH
jgi:hypothetical protein